jgi:signal transduction histidine kinase
MTGATGVQLLLWNPERHAWVPAPDSATGTVQIPHTPDRAAEPLVPLSVLRYVQRLGEPLVVTDATEDDRFARDPYFTDLDRCSLLAVPILSRGALQAVLLLENRLIRGAFTADRLDVVRLIAGQLAVSLTNARLYAELTSSRARIVTAADQARRRIERDLHDGAQQRLVSLVLQARATRAAVAPELAYRLDGLAAEANDALEELREIARGIHPAGLAGGGVRPALKGLARRSAVPVRLRVGVEDRLPESIEIAAYYVVAEALTNAAKHAQATVVDVEVDAGDGALRIAVCDDGRGGADFAGGSGLIGLKDRVEALGGRIAMDSPHGAGTTLRIALPLRPTEAAETTR